MGCVLVSEERVVVVVVAVVLVAVVVVVGVVVEVLVDVVVAVVVAVLVVDAGKEHRVGLVFTESLGTIRI